MCYEFAEICSCIHGGVCSLMFSVVHGMVLLILVLVSTQNWIWSTLISIHVYSLMDPFGIVVCILINLIHWPTAS